MDNLNYPIEFEGKTVAEAIETALEKLKKNKEDLSIEILRDPSKTKFFGFKLKAKIKVSLKKEMSSAPATETPEKEKRPPKREKRPYRERESREEEYVPEKKEYPPIDESQLSELGLQGKQFIDQILTDLELGAKVVAVEETEDSVYFDLEAENPKVVIGKNGVLLESMQTLTYMVVNRGDGEWKKILIDVDQYRRRREKKLQSRIHDIAQRVRRSGRAYLTPSYPPYERRMIHVVVQKMKGVSSHSEGNGLYKRVWIRPE